MKFATKYNITHLTLGMLLNYLGKLTSHFSNFSHFKISLYYI